MQGEEERQLTGVLQQIVVATNGSLSWGAPSLYVTHNLATWLSKQSPLKTVHVTVRHSVLCFLSCNKQRSCRSTQVLTHIAEQLPLLAGSCDLSEIGDSEAVVKTMRAVRDVCNHFRGDSIIVSGKPLVEDFPKTLVSFCIDLGHKWREMHLQKRDICQQVFLLLDPIFFCDAEKLGTVRHSCQQHLEESALSGQESRVVEF